jgi:hypothetical protein
MGREPREITEVFDGDGHLVSRTVTRREPEFTSREVNLLIASKELQDDLNPYGIPYSEATDPKNEHAFVADPMPTIDHAAKKVLDAQDAYYKQWPDASSNGHLWRVRRSGQ